MSTTYTCSYCHTALGEEDAPGSCPACGAVYHAECWQENGGCSEYGCIHTPVTEARSELEVPVSWWGRENKPCPSCNKEILAAAVRCRHCGATFASARPEDAAEFQKRSNLEEMQPKLRRSVVVQFALSIFPLTAPVGAIMGLVWYLPRRREVATLPTLYPALAKLGLGIGSLQTIAFVVLTSLYAVLNHSS